MIQQPLIKFLSPIVRGVVQRRSQSVVSSPPTEKISDAEIWILGGGMCVAMCVVPAWVLYHIREYRGLK